MEITDQSFRHPKQKISSNHSPLFPRNIFCVIAGATGCGKTNLMEYLLSTEKVLDYADVYIYSSTLHQPTYAYLKEYYGKLEKDIKNKHKIGHFFDADAEIQNPSELDKNKTHIMVFDDVMNADQSVIKDYFCRGRHNNVNVFYLCQSLLKIKKHCIRENANVFILFHQGAKTLKYFYDDQISGDMDFDEFTRFCEKAWKKKYGFVVINVKEEAFWGKYISNYTVNYTPNKYLKIPKNT